MQSVLARDILHLDTISKGNDKPWNRLMEYIDENPGVQPIEFDFKGISVVQPCSSTSFLKLLANQRFYMVLHNDAGNVNNIHIVCTLNNIPPDKIRNIEVAVPKQKTAEEKNIEAMVEQLMPYMEETDDGVVLNVHKRFDQIGQLATVKYIAGAIQHYIDVNGPNHFTVYTKMMSIQPSIIAAIADMVDTFKKSGIDVVVKSDDKEVQNKIDMAIDIGKRAYDSQERLDIMRSRLVKNRVGILIKYKEGRAKDEFGREGRGEKRSARIAQFKGFSHNRDGEVCAKFRTYNSNYFYTKEHWFLEHDREELKELVYDDIVVKVNDLGIYNDFLGAKYHFSTAIQYEPGGEITMYGLNDIGSVTDTVMTIPDRIKAVFDDFGIEYDEESLEAYIEETRKILGLE